MLNRPVAALFAAVALFAAPTTASAAPILASFDFTNGLNPTGGELQGSTTPFSNAGITTLSIASGFSATNLRYRMTTNTTGFMPGNYAEFTVNADPGEVLDLDELTFQGRRSGIGRETFLIVRSSLDGFTNDLFNGLFATGAVTANTVPLSGLPLTPSVTFRFYLQNPGTNPPDQNLTQAPEVDLDNVTVTGVSGPAEVPEPATLAVFGALAGVAGWRVRRRTTAA